MQGANVTTYVDHKTLERLERLSRDAKISKAAILKQALKEYLEREGYGQ